jgi:hypothetical protein
MSRGPGSSAALRKMLAAGVACAFLAGSAEAASDKAKRYPAATGKREAEKNPFGDLSKSTLQLVVSIASQHVTLYSNGVRVAQVPVSTGTPARPTPTGVFSIIEKDRWHRSNLYDNAPMFFMQRLTWSGVAMHEGILPGVPASHGCIRLPHDFAARLWGVTKLGVRIVVARNDVVPQEFSHPALFAPKPKPVDKPIAAGGGIEDLRRTVAVDAVAIRDATVGQVEFAGAESAETLVDSEPVRNTKAIDTTAPDLKAKLAESVTGGEFQRTAAVPAVEEPVKPGLDSGDPRKPAPLKKAAEPAKHSGQVAVFISRKEKKIFVRQGFVPLFDMPIEVADPDRPLGTHVFSAIEVQDNGLRMRWNVISVSGEQSFAAERNSDSRRKSGRNRAPVPEPMVEARPPSPAQALSRIQMPQEATDRIGELLVPGSSLIISDQGLGPETGRYTEFVVLTH